MLPVLSILHALFFRALSLEQRLLLLAFALCFGSYFLLLALFACMSPPCVPGLREFPALYLRALACGCAIFVCFCLRLA